MSAQYTRYIKIARKDKDGNDNSNSLSSLTTLSIPWSDGSTVTYNVITISPHPEYFVYTVEYKSTDFIHYPDAANLEYDFIGDMNTDTQISPFNIESKVEFIPIGTVSTDNLKFLSGTNHYQIDTLNQKTITINFSGLFTFDNSLLSGADLRVGLYLVNPSNDPNFTNPISETSLTLQPQTITFTHTLPIAVVPGYEIRMGVRRMGATNVSGPMSFNFNPNSTLTISSTSAVGPTSSVAIDPGLDYRFQNSDCDVLQNNVGSSRQNSHTQIIDNTTSQNIPANIDPLTIYEAQHSDVPMSNYTKKSQINPRYLGTKNQSSDFNLFESGNPVVYPVLSSLGYTPPTNIGTYGQTPSVSVLDVNVYEFDYGKNPSPEILGAGELKMGAILQVDSTSSVKPVDPNSNAKTFLRETDGLPSNVFPIISDPYYWLRTPFISQSVNDYYYTLNGNNPPNHPIALYTYTKDSTGDIDAIYPTTTQIIDTSFGVPKQSNFIIPSNVKFGAGSFGAGLISRNSEFSYMQLYEGKYLFYANANYSTGSMVSPSLLFEGEFSSFNKANNSTQPNGASQSDPKYTQQTSSMVPIAEQLNQGERWFCSFYENLESDGGNIQDLRPFKLNESPLGERGVIEISGVRIAYFNSDGNRAFEFLFKDQITTINVGFNRQISGEFTAPPLGMLMWKALAPNKSEYVIVKDPIVSANNGAFISGFSPKYVLDNLEKITQEFGSNKL